MWSLYFVLWQTFQVQSSMTSSNLPLYKLFWKCHLSSKEGLAACLLTSSFSNFRTKLTHLNSAAAYLTRICSALSTSMYHTIIMTAIKAAFAAVVIFRIRSINEMVKWHNLAQFYLTSFAGNVLFTSANVRKTCPCQGAHADRRPQLFPGRQWIAASIDFGTFCCFRSLRQGNLSVGQSFLVA